MHITQETDYAIRIVFCLCKSELRRDARSISEETDVSLRFALKILGKLGNAGIVKSFKGNKGGYELAKKPADISLYDIIYVFEGTPSVCRCTSEGCNSAGKIDKCPFYDVFYEISEELSEKLKSVNFQAVLQNEDKNVIGRLKQ